MNHAPGEILWLFRNPRHRSAHRAFVALGEERVTEIIDEAWAVRDRLRKRRATWESRRGSPQES
jgi:hypothetical protein